MRDRRTFQNYLRILGWINGVWEKAHQRTAFYDWDAAAFSRATGRKGGKKIAVRTLERVFPQFQGWCQEYYFTRINVGGRWRVRVTRNPYVQNIGGNQVHDRLVARLRKHVEKAGRIKIDAEWCRKFSEISHLSTNAVEHAWLKISKIDGLKHKWRGAGRGRKLCVEDPARWAQICTDRAAERAARKNQKFAGSDPQTSPPVSISYGNDKIKTSGPTARFPEESARPAAASELPRGENGRVGEGGAEPGGWEHPDPKPYFGRWFPGRAPLQICNRLVLPQNLQRKAAWLAIARLKFAHDYFPRVRFAFPHARNFALAALRFGYAEPAIVAAWSEGVARSHADAVDCGESGADAPRPPSAAKVYAWNFLRATDPRSPAELWREFFATPRASPAAPPVRRGRKIPAIETALPSKMAKARAALEAKPSAAAPAQLTLGELRATCEKIGITIGSFNALPWARKKEIVDRAIAARKI